MLDPGRDSPPWSVPRGAMAGRECDRGLSHRRPAGERSRGLTLIELLLLIALIALLVLLWINRPGQPATGGTWSPPPPYPVISGSSSVAAGTVTLAIGEWSGPTAQAWQTTKTYRFLRRTYNPAAPGNPISDAPGIAVSFRLIPPSSADARVVAVRSGQVVPGSADRLAAGVTGSDGVIEVDVEVERMEHSNRESMTIWAEELARSGQQLRGTAWVVEVGPP